MLDEPSASQSDATVLELQLRAVSKKQHGGDVTVGGLVTTWQGDSYRMTPYEEKGCPTVPPTYPGTCRHASSVMLMLMLMILWWCLLLPSLAALSPSCHDYTQVRSIENAAKHPAEIERWINSINDLHRSKPPPQVGPSPMDGPSSPLTPHYCTAAVWILVMLPGALPQKHAGHRAAHGRVARGVRGGTRTGR